MGLKLILGSIPRYVRFECPDGDATFSIHQVEKSPKGNGITIYFKDENLDDWVKKLMTKGIIFTELPNNKPWLWREVHLKNLDSNNIILFY